MQNSTCIATTVATRQPFTDNAWRSMLSNIAAIAAIATAASPTIYGVTRAHAGGESDGLISRSFAWRSPRVSGERGAGVAAASRR